MKAKSILLLFAVVLLVSFAVVAEAQPEDQTPVLLVVDESKSLEVSMRVQGLIRAITSQSDVKVKTKVATVKYATENPLQGEEDLSVDAVIIVPPTIETGRVKQVWVVTRPYSSIPLEMRAEVGRMMEQLKEGIKQAFSGKAIPIDVHEDVIPAYFSTLFLNQGILR